MSPENPGSGAMDQSVESQVLRLSDARLPVILVAEDDAVFRRLVTSLMQRDGYSVLAAADGREGLEISRQFPGVIDLLITDVHMPRLNGIDLCAHLFRERPAIRVLFVTGADVSEFAALNADLPVLTKPINGHTLRTKVRAILADRVRSASSSE